MGAGKILGTVMTVHATGKLIKTTRKIPTGRRRKRKGGRR